MEERRTLSEDAGSIPVISNKTSLNPGRSFVVSGSSVMRCLG